MARKQLNRASSFVVNAEVLLPGEIKFAYTDGSIHVGDEENTAGGHRFANDAENAETFQQKTVELTTFIEVLEGENAGLVEIDGSGITSVVPTGAAGLAILEAEDANEVNEFLNTVTHDQLADIRGAGLPQNILDFFRQTLPPVVRSPTTDFATDVQVLNIWPMMDTTAGKMIPAISGSLIKQTDAVWAAGNNAGGWDSVTAPTAFQGCFVFLIGKTTDATAVDVLLSANPTTPTMPSDWDLKRRIGSMRFDGSVALPRVTSNAGGNIVQYRPSIEVVTAATVGTTVSHFDRFPGGDEARILVHATNADGDFYLSFTSLGVVPSVADKTNSQMYVAAGAVGHAEVRVPMSMTTLGRISCLSSRDNTVIDISILGFTDTRLS